MSSTAILKGYNQAPRKMRLLADLIRGKKIDKAMADLEFSNKKGSLAFKKLINSAVANAKHNEKVSPDDLFVKEVTVNAGIVSKRGMPRAFGRSFLIKKRSSLIKVVVDAKEAKPEKKAAIKKINKK